MITHVDVDGCPDGEHDGPHDVESCPYCELQQARLMAEKWRDIAVKIVGDIKREDWPFLWEMEK